VLSFNRGDALGRTLRELRSTSLIAEIIVVDNASRDSSPDIARDALRGHPAARVITLAENVGVDGFNIGARESQGDLLLILDDDSWPDPQSLCEATQLVASDAAIGGVALLPVHPTSNISEWPHAQASTRFPMMGCGNLLRREAWFAAGGYASAYFLYRNDTDLALSMLGLGWQVHFRPQWRVWHDSVHAAHKSDRWLHLATRNWLWMTRRHGRGVWKWVGGALGVLRALQCAGMDNSRIERVTQGIREGVSAVPCDTRHAADGSHYARLIRMQLHRHGLSADRSSSHTAE
jgi:GT2 family glycosyltransferase